MRAFWLALLATGLILVSIDVTPAARRPHMSVVVGTGDRRWTATQRIGPHQARPARPYTKRTVSSPQSRTMALFGSTSRQVGEQKTRSVGCADTSDSLNSTNVAAAAMEERLNAPPIPRDRSPCGGGAIPIRVTNRAGHLSFIDDHHLRQADPVHDLGLPRVCHPELGHALDQCESALPRLSAGSWPLLRVPDQL